MKDVKNPKLKKYFIEYITKHVSDFPNLLIL
jgi:hypothetical protein